MGSKAIQGPLWGQHAKEWTDIQERTGRAGYEYVLEYLHLQANGKLLDVGCASGYFCNLAKESSAIVTGVDASEPRSPYRRRYD